MLISCGTKKTRSIYMANTVSKNERKTIKDGNRLLTAQFYSMFFSISTGI